MANSSRILTTICEKFDVWMDECRTKSMVYRLNCAMTSLSKIVFVICVNHPLAELASSSVPTVCPLVEKMLDLEGFEVHVWAAQIYSHLERHADSVAVLDRVKNVSVALETMCNPHPQNWGLRNASATLLALAYKDDPTPKRSSQYVFGDVENYESNGQGLLPYFPQFVFAEDPLVRDEVLEVLSLCFGNVDGDEHCWARGNILMDHPDILRGLIHCLSQANRPSNYTVICIIEQAFFVGDSLVAHEAIDYLVNHGLFEALTENLRDETDIDTLDDVRSFFCDFLYDSLEVCGGAAYVKERHGDFVTALQRLSVCGVAESRVNALEMLRFLS